MNYIFALIVPVIFLASFAYASFKKVKVYDSFCQGVKAAPPLILSIFPYIAAVMMLTKLFEVSGLQARFETLIAPVFNFLGVPEEISPLILMKPLSGGGSIAVLTDILEKYGVDSYIARCACVAYGASDTIFYIGAVYFAGLKRKKLTAALVISVFSYLCSILLCCLLCKVM
ncbi:MAG: spore maturation protein [Clostridia bacterium]|nr:spore maturation protein [Clostridia bacterium]